MHYYIRPDALIFCGTFRAVSSSVSGGSSDVSTLLSISIPAGFSKNAAQYRFFSPEFGLMTVVPVNNTCIVQYDEVTAFATAAVSDRNQTVNLIVVSSLPMTNSTLLDALMTVTEAIVKVLTKRRIGSACLSTDAAIITAEKMPGPTLEFAGPLTDIGKRIHLAVTFALTEALARFDNYLLSNGGISHGWATGKYSALSRLQRPSYFVYSRYGGDHWTEWLPEGCPYHPCHHFPEQVCTFCYCPLYPCWDTEFSERIDTPRGKIRSCQDCRFIHGLEVEHHLWWNPEAGITELKGARNRVSGN